MANRPFTGAGWTGDLPFSPKKRQAYEDKLAPRHVVQIEDDIEEVLPATPPRRFEIGDSEAEDSDDEDDLFPDFHDLVPSANRSAGIATSTPTKKPLNTNLLPAGALSPERRKKEFSALIKDAEEAKNLDKIANEAELAYSSPPKYVRPENLDDRTLYERAVDIVQDEAGEVDSEQEEQFAKIRRVMQRQAATHSAPHYYFFAPVDDEAFAGGSPSRRTAGPLQKPGSSHEISLAMKSKLATKFFLEPGINLPDDLVVWILGVFPTERSEWVREEYLQILTQRTMQMGKLVDEKQLKQWFLSVGADKDAVSLGEKGEVAMQRDAPMDHRDWSTFYNTLELLRQCCHTFRDDVAIYAAVILLRASMDSEVRLQASLAAPINETLLTLVSNVPKAVREKFCRKVCNLFVQTVDSVSLLSRAVEATHHAELRLSDTSRTPEEFMPFKDLRTYLQLSVFFKDAEKVTPQRCGDAWSLLHSILDRLDEPDFKSSPGTRGDMNYYDLDGYALVLTEIIPYLHSLRQRITDKSERSEFDDSVDSLHRKINQIISKIQITGPVDDFDARYEAKSRLQALIYRLSYFFPKRKTKGLFNDEFTAEEAEAAQRRVVKQQNFMANFLHKRAGKPE